MPRILYIPAEVALRALKKVLEILDPIDAPVNPDSVEDSHLKQLEPES